jgi:hypothetical protein
MTTDTDGRSVSTVIRWTDDEWREIAAHLCAKQGAEQMRSLDPQKIKAKDVFLAQRVLPEERHRKLVSISQGFAGIRARLKALTQTLPDAKQAVPYAEKEKAGLDRGAAVNTEVTVPAGLEHAIEASRQIAGCGGLTGEQSSRRNVIPEKQGSKSGYESLLGCDRLQRYVETPDLLEAMRPFMLMVCEEFAKAFAKVYLSRYLKQPLPAASHRMRSGATAFREEALHVSVGDEMQPNFSTGKTDLQRRYGGESDIERVDFDFASQVVREEEALDVQPLFDPKLPPTADSDFKPKIGLVSTPGSDVGELRRCYPQLHLTIVEAERLFDVRRFGHCQRIIALCNEVSPGTDALLSELLRHRYIRLNGGMTAVKAQLDAWLAAPGSIAAVSRHRLSFGGMKGKTPMGKKRQIRYAD